MPTEDTSLDQGGQPPTQPTPNQPPTVTPLPANTPNQGGQPPTQPTPNQPPTVIPLPANTQIPVSAGIRIAGQLSDGALARIQTSVQRYAEELASKIDETESQERASGEQSREITASTVIKAADKLRSGQPDAQKASAFDIALFIIAPISSGAAGIMGSYLNSVWQAAIFGAITMLAIVSTVAVVLRQTAGTHG